PGYDASVRVAITLGRRIQDPLTEYVKTEPSQLSVGLYQYDVRARHLREFLEEAVTACVSQVGLNVNVAMPSQLRYIAGLNRLTARKIYDYRQANGPFVNREQLKSVPGLSEQAWSQAIGFLRIYGGDQILDGTPIHPAQYPIAAKLMEMAGVDPRELGSPEATEKWNALAGTLDLEALARELEGDTGMTEPSTEISSPVAENPEPEGGLPSETAGSGTAEPETTDDGPFAESSETKDGMGECEGTARSPMIGPRTLSEIFESLRDPMYDVRDTMPGPIFRRDRLRPEELVPGAEYLGVVQNIVPFGAFVDIGMQDCGLVHVSELADRFVRDPQEVVSVGDVIRVRVLKVTPGRVSLTMISGKAATGQTSREKGTGRGEGSRPERREQSGRREDWRGGERSGERTGARSSGGGDRSAYGRGRTGTPGRGPGQDRGNRSGGDRRGGGGDRRERSGGRIGTYVAAAPEQPVRPLSEEVRSGKAPMRSFADLLQFYTQPETGESGAPSESKSVTPAESSSETTPESPAEKPDDGTESTSGTDET
ncbi:MAG: helix-hairpin-helix domain-containing protein, partial [Planctomycetia bacterium]|nr:helix-hairpin-helix domain-containing protein [Planctomycetia bacterium]